MSFFAPIHNIVYRFQKTLWRASCFISVGSDNFFSTEWLQRFHFSTPERWMCDWPSASVSRF